MPRYCAAYGCTNNAAKQSCKERNVSYHRFPLNDDVLLKRWLILINRKDFLPGYHSVLCSEHFKENDFTYQTFTNRREIKKDAVPSIFAHKTAEKRKSYLLGASLATNTIPEPEPATQDACCFALKCVLDHDKIREENKIDEKRNLLFLPQKNDELLEKWERMIIRNEPRYQSVQADKRKESSELNIDQKSSFFFKLSSEVKNISMPSSWWSVTCTEDCIIFAKWNLKYFSERRIVICKDSSIKIFLMNVEVSLSVEECTIKIISKLLQKVDDFIICKNADSGSSSGCLGFVVDEREEFCHTCYESKQVEKDNQNLVGKKMKSVSQIKNINKRNTYPRKRISDLKRKLVKSKCLSSRTKQNFLEAISHLPVGQQTAIKSCHSFKTWFL